MNATQQSEGEQQDLSGFTNVSDQNVNKHQRFNLRQVNLPPLKRDHSRSVDYTYKILKDKLESSQGQQEMESQNQMNPSSDLSNLQPNPHMNFQMLSDNVSQNSIIHLDPGYRQQAVRKDTNYLLRKNSIEERRARRKKLNLRENLSPQQLQMNGDYLLGGGTDLDSKISGRWSREEHEKFIEAMSMYGKDWKKVETYIGSRSGAQIRSHAQKFFNRIEKELGGNVEAYIQQKAETIRTKRQNKSNGTGENEEDSYQIQIRKGSFVQENQALQLARDRSISHTFGFLKEPEEKVGQQQEWKVPEAQQALFVPQKLNPESIHMNQQSQQHIQKSLPLQQILFESFSSYRNPQEHSPLCGNIPTANVIPQQLKINFEQKIVDIQKEKQIIQNQLFNHFNQALSTPQNIQIYIDELKRIHSDLTDTYSQVKASHQPELLSKNTETVALSNMIELLNNVQILSQLQSLLDFQIQTTHKKSSGDMKGEFQVPQRDQGHPVMGDQIQYQMQKGNDHSADTQLVKQFAGIKRERKLSEFLQSMEDRGNHASQKQQIETAYNLKPQMFSVEHNPSAFKKMVQGLAAGPFKPSNNTENCMQSIQRLRGLSNFQEQSGHDNSHHVEDNKQHTLFC